MTADKARSGRSGGWAFRESCRLPRGTSARPRHARATLRRRRRLRPGTRRAPPEASPGRRRRGFPRSWLLLLLGGELFAPFVGLVLLAPGVVELDEALDG